MIGAKGGMAELAQHSRCGKMVYVKLVAVSMAAKAIREIFPDMNFSRSVELAKELYQIGAGKKDIRFEEEDTHPASMY